MILENDGNTFELQIREFAVALRAPIKNTDIGASTSSTSSVNAGTKAKVLTVTGVLPFTEAEHLTKLLDVAEAIDESGARIVYNISDDTAEAANIRQVIFNEAVTASKRKELQAWDITFILIQKNSVAEAVETRNTETEQVVTDSATGTAVTSDLDEEIETQQGMVYALLKRLDQFLEPGS